MSASRAAPASRTPRVAPGACGSRRPSGRSAGASAAVSRSSASATAISTATSPRSRGTAPPRRGRAIRAPGAISAQTGTAARSAISARVPARRRAGSALALPEPARAGPVLAEVVAGVELHEGAHLVQARVDPVADAARERHRLRLASEVGRARVPHPGRLPHRRLAVLEEVVRREERREPRVEAPADELVEHRPLPLRAALLAELVDREHRDVEEPAQDVHVAAALREAGLDVREEQHELHVARGDPLLEREVAQRRDEEVRLPGAGAAVEEEPLRRLAPAELAREVLGDDLRALVVLRPALEVLERRLRDGGRDPDLVEERDPFVEVPAGADLRDGVRPRGHERVARLVAARAGLLAGAAARARGLAEHLLDDVSAAAAGTGAVWRGGHGRRSLHGSAEAGEPRRAGQIGEMRAQRLAVRTPARAR